MFKKKNDNKSETRTKNENSSKQINDFEFFNSSNSDETIKFLNENWSDNPYRLIATLIHSTSEDMDISLVLIIIEMIRLEYINFKDLAILGIDADELSNLISAVVDNDSHSSLREDLHVRAAIREYDRVIIEIVNDNNLNHDLLSEFRTCLAEFASENSITDLKVAYKYLQATEPERLTPFKLT